MGLSGPSPMQNRMALRTHKSLRKSAGEIEAQFNGAVNHFHRYQREYTKAQRFELASSCSNPFLLWAISLECVHTLLGMNPYTSKSGSGESGNASSKPSSRLVHDKEYFADLVGVDVKTCELQMTFLRQLVRQPRELVSFRNASRTPRAAKQKKVLGTP